MGFSDSLYSSLTQSPDILANAPFESVDRMRTRYDQVRQVAPNPDTSMSILEGIGKVLNYPGNVVRSALFGSQGDLTKALLGQKQFSTQDQLTKIGMQDGWLKTGLGFIGDVVTDPLTFTGSGLIKHGGQAALESGLAHGIASKTAGKAAAKTAAQTGFDAQKVADALTAGFKKPITPEMNSVDVARAALGNQPLTGQNLAGIATRTNTALSTATGQYRSANQSLSALLAEPARGIVGKTSDVRSQLAEGIASGTLTGKNAWRSSEPRSFIDIYDRLNKTMATPLKADDIDKLIKLHVDDSAHIHSILNIAEQFGSKVKDFDSLNSMAAKFADADYVDKIAKANAKLLGARESKDAARIRAVYTNNLIADIDKLGTRRYWGIQSPTGKAILPLVDVTPVAQAVDNAANAVYKKSKVYKGVSDWFRTAITGDFTRSAYMESPQLISQLEKGRGIVKGFNQTKQIMSHIGADFLQNSLGKEVMEADPRVLVGAVYGTERNILREVEEGVDAINDPYTAYIWGNIAEDAGATALSTGELEYAKNYILDHVGQEGLQHIHDTIIDPFLTKGGKLTQQEIDLAAKYAEKAKFNTDVLFQHEKLQGSPLTNADYNPNYMYHIYDTEGSQALPASAKASGLRASKERSYTTIGEAIANDLKLKPIDNLVDLQAARFNASIHYGMNRALLNGVDELFSSKMQTKLTKLVADKSEDDLLNSVDDLAASGQATVDATVKALGGKEGLKALKDVVKAADKLHPEDIRSGNWVPMDSIFGTTRTGGLYYAHKELWPYLELIERPMTNSTALNQLLEYSDNVTRIIKTIQTTLNPSFAPRNFAGEALMSFGNGTAPEAIQDAANIIKNIHGTTELNGKSVYVQEAAAKLKVMQDTDTVNLAGREMSVSEARRTLTTDYKIDLGNGRTSTIQEIYDSATRNGLITAGHTAEYATKDTDRINQMVGGATWKGKMKKAYTSSDNKAVGAVKAGVSGAESAANYGDSLFRVADYVHNLRQGFTEAEAATKVKLFHVDYNNLTQFEKGVMRRIVPYYTFMRQNVPMQLKLLMERPAYYGTIAKLIDNSYNSLGDPATPDYLKKSLALPIYEDDEGNVTYLNWNLPLADLSKFRVDPRDTGRELLQSIHPGIKAPFELATGHNIAYQSPVNPASYLGNQLGGASTAYKAVAEYAAPDAQFEGQYAAPQQHGVFRSMAPVVNPEKEQLSRAYAYRERLLEDMKKRKKAGQPIPELPALPSFGRSSFGLTPYSINPNYSRNRDWVRNNANMFTP